MCTIVYYNNTPKVAKEDITCFKVLQIPRRKEIVQVTNNNNWGTYYKKTVYKGIYYTPYFFGTVDKKTISGKKDFSADGEPFIEELDSGYGLKMYRLKKGFIHTFKNYIDAKHLYDYFKKCYDSDFCLFECVIPKGTEFFIGTNEMDNSDNFASKKIRFIKKMEESCV